MKGRKMKKGTGGTDDEVNKTVDANLQCSLPILFALRNIEHMPMKDVETLLIGINYKNSIEGITNATKKDLKKWLEEQGFKVWF